MVAMERAVLAIAREMRADPAVARAAGRISRRRDCLLTDIPSPVLLNHLLKGEGGPEK